MSNREATYPCRRGAPARHTAAATRGPRLALRLWVYRAALSLLCRVAFAGRRWHHDG